MAKKMKKAKAKKVKAGMAAKKAVAKAMKGGAY